MRVLEELSPKIHLLVNIDCLLPYLIRYDVMENSEYSILNSLFLTRGQKADKLLEFLRKKDDDTLKRFLQALKEENDHLGHEDLCKLFEEKLKYINI